MKPEKTVPMVRKDVNAFISLIGIQCSIAQLHDEICLAKLMFILGPVYAAYEHSEYHAVMGALLHFWKQSK